jgi:putative tricarboxylic transport membrane protein
VLVPIVVYVIGISLLGIYVASLLLIGYFMRRYGKYGWAATAAVSIGVPLAFFLVFERWFLVLLPKGPIERLLGM